METYFKFKFIEEYVVPLITLAVVVGIPLLFCVVSTIIKKIDEWWRK